MCDEITCRPMMEDATDDFELCRHCGDPIEFTRGEEYTGWLHCDGDLSCYLGCIAEPVNRSPYPKEFDIYKGGTMYCPKALEANTQHNPHADDDLYCWLCGTKLLEAGEYRLPCPKGHATDKSDVFCPKCGIPLSRRDRRQAG